MYLFTQFPSAVWRHVNTATSRVAADGIPHFWRKLHASVVAAGAKEDAMRRRMRGRWTADLAGHGFSGSGPSQRRGEPSRRVRVSRLIKQPNCQRCDLRSIVVTSQQPNYGDSADASILLRTFQQQSLTAPSFLGGGSKQKLKSVS